MSKSKTEFGIISRLLIIAFYLGIIMMAVYPKRKEIKSTLKESKAELKKDYPLFFNDGRGNLSSEENKLLVQTPAAENKKALPLKNNKTMDKLSKSDRQELDKLINQK